MSNNATTKRPPVIAVMGHVDHGKSTLLDYIRKENTVDGEAGGITQHISAYEVHHKDAEGNDRRITFLDTPGHEAFSNMRARGASTADIAILIVAADDGVNKQTLEAYKTIQKSETPFIVAINKIDKPGADVQKTKTSLIENEIYIEGWGGDIPCVEISAKQGTNIDDLLETLLLVADLEDLTGDTEAPATGVVIESHRDPKKGISATIVIKDGTLKKGMFVVAEHAMSTTRIFEDFTGKTISEATFSSPIVITGWNEIPPVGAMVQTTDTKKEAEKICCAVDAGIKSILLDTLSDITTHETKLVPLIIKTDVEGTFEAIEQEILKLQNDQVAYKLIDRGVGNISEKDVSFAKADGDVVIVGFNTNIDNAAFDLNEQVGATIKTFTIIYELIQWLEEELEKRRPRKEMAEVHGQAKVLKTFSRTKDKQVLGGKVKTGEIKKGDMVRIMRNEEEIGRGKILGMQQNKIDTDIVKDGFEFGAMIEAKEDIQGGDLVEAFTLVTK